MRAGHSRHCDLPAPVTDNFDGVAALFEEKLSSGNLNPVIARRQDNITASTTVQNDGGSLLAIGSGVAESNIVKRRCTAVDSEGDLVSCLLEATNISGALRL